MNEYKIDFAALAWQSPAPGLRQKVYRQGDRQIRLLEFARGFVEPDWCARGHLGYLLEGRLEINFLGAKVSYGPGEGIYIPAGPEHRHKAAALTDTALLVLVEEV
ncbi:MAG: cupin domain-containing protein [Desulfarculus sp.]|jgi:quercetin dioxygenase-like cupin family protein|nr:MAG: cupin domain-containing protein [Desulfarculus sp.]